MKNVDTLIIGAGVTGLAYANFCNKDYLIIEKENEAGGLCRTFYKDDFIWDYAGHFFHFKTTRLKQFFDARIDREEIVICNKNTKIFYKGEMIDYPFQMNIHQLSKEEFIDCLYDLFHREQKENYGSFQDMLYGKFGKAITEKFLKPYNEKLYACDLESLDVDAMGRFFPYAAPDQIIENMRKPIAHTYNDTFEYPLKGAITFIQALMKSISSDNIWLQSKLESLDINNKMAVVNGQQIKYSRLINTMPLNRFIDFLPDGLTKELKGRLKANKVLVFNLGFDRKSLYDDIHWLYFPDKSCNFYRVGFYDNIMNTPRLSLYVEIGFKTDDIIDVETELEKTLYNLKKCGITDDHELLAFNHVVIDPAYVHISTETRKGVCNLLKELESYNVFSLGRYGSWTYCSIEDCMCAALDIINKEKG